jgi:hypothetical protein
VTTPACAALPWLQCPPSTDMQTKPTGDHQLSRPLATHPGVTGMLHHQGLQGTACCCSHGEVSQQPYSQTSIHLPCQPHIALPGGLPVMWGGEGGGEEQAGHNDNNFAQIQCSASVNRLGKL